MNSTIDQPPKEIFSLTSTTLENKNNDDGRISQIIKQRVEIANHPSTVFVSHEDVFAASQARLLVKLNLNSVHPSAE